MVSQVPKVGRSVVGGHKIIHGVATGFPKGGRQTVEGQSVVHSLKIAKGLGLGSSLFPGSRWKGQIVGILG